ncbi:hypothetical protein Pelo_8218 [Pelomyxa schiedti]|nr:hypothetical protein Pelo_8218 [Pelomyxa schiedti]
MTNTPIASSQTNRRSGIVKQLSTTFRRANNNTNSRFMAIAGQCDRHFDDYPALRKLSTAGEPKTEPLNRLNTWYYIPSKTEAVLVCWEPGHVPAQYQDQCVILKGGYSVAAVDWQNPLWDLCGPSGWTVLQWRDGPPVMCQHIRLGNYGKDKSRGPNTLRLYVEGAIGQWYRTEYCFVTAGIVNQVNTESIVQTKRPAPQIDITLQSTTKKPRPTFVCNLCSQGRKKTRPAFANHLLNCHGLSLTPTDITQPNNQHYGLWRCE